MFVKLSKLISERSQTSNLERRCVADVMKKGDKDLSRAFAICRSSLQKSGRMKAGTAQLTKLGASRSSASGRKKDNKSKISYFEKKVKAARK